ncbi:MAG: T9SS type A sorting domain-containing protein, partial [Chitinophagaceae bacterium]
RSANGSGSWGTQTASFGSYADNSGSSTRELAIPWSLVGGIPSSFNFLGYVTSGGGFVFNQVPTLNAGATIGTSAIYRYYYTVSTTANSVATKPFSRTSIATASTASLATAGTFFDVTVQGGTTSLTANHNVVGTVTVNTGSTLNTGGNITLVSNASGSAKVGNSGGTISGNVTVQHYIPGGRRAFRFLAHPFTDNLSLSSLTDDFDITGSGGSPFTATLTNNPSALMYNNATANSTVTPTDPGWTALTATSTWNSKTGLNVLIRGSVGQGLDGNSYTPNPVTIDYSGALNTGNQVFTLSRANANAEYNLIPNPYASPINLGSSAINAAKGSAINANFHVWDANLGARGAYATSSFGTSYILPAGASFFARTTDGSLNNTITITESDKSTATPVALFSTSDASGKLTLQLNAPNGKYADRLQFYFDDKLYTANDDKLWDAFKMANPDVNMFSFSADAQKLAIDRRPIVNGAKIPVEINLSSENSEKYTLSFENVVLKDSETLIFRDNLMKTETFITNGKTISLELSKSKNGPRFEIVMSKKSESLIQDQTAQQFSASLQKTIFSEQLLVNINAANSAETTVQLINELGQVVALKNAGNVSSGTISVETSNLSNGLYFVRVQNGNNAVILKAVKN